MMELGATVCHRQKPLCLTCAVRTFCRAAAAGDPESYPRLAPKVIERKEITRVWCVRDGALLLHRTSAASRRLANVHELPAAEHVALGNDAVRGAPCLATRRRGITRYAITETIHAMTLPRGITTQPTPPAETTGELVWVALDALETVLLSGPHRRWVNELLRAGHGRTEG
jgi:A/G-specific adenine glycosylase